jgi:hypothetical protein
LLALGFLLIPLLPDIDAASNPNLYVSAENPLYDNHFAGSMVIEVVVTDSNLSDTGESEGEPDVTINGDNLRMVQTTDGRWHAYFANVDKAKIADQIFADVGVAGKGKGLDFGVFCGKDTTSLGPSFSETEGIAIPRETMMGSTNGNSAFNTCTGSPSGNIINNVVRNPKSINTNSAILSGQIGLDANAWPIIQLYSFGNDVTIQYNTAGGTQQVVLNYDDIPNIKLGIDRNNYPPGAEVFATINDMQLNQDPTSRDSWTFNVGPPQTTFYAAFTDSGADAANGGAGLVNLIPKLTSLGFEKNGRLSMNLGTVVQLSANGFQPINADDGPTTYTQIVTFVESEPNSSIFENFDSSDNSNIEILSAAPRGQSAAIEYNSKSTSILSGLGTASMSLGATQIVSGHQIPIIVTDPDQNINSGKKDDLDVFRSTAIIPSLTIGNPITLEKATDVKIHNPASVPPAGGTNVASSVPDNNSDMLILNTVPLGIQNFEQISIDLGVTAIDLKNLLINVADADNFGTNWVNYDFRSLERQLGIADFSDTTVSLSFGSLAGPSVTLISAGGMTGAQGFVQLSDVAVASINLQSGKVFLVINFDASNNSAPQGLISNEGDTQPIVFDLFSFGQKNNKDVNNAIYRFELEETSYDSGVFSGTLEYLIANQLNQFDANTIKTLQTISDDVKFFVNQRLIDEKGINIAYSDISKVGLTESTSSKTDINTHSGKVSLNAKTFRFGQPVTIVLNDPDLNVKHDIIDIYTVINDPASPNVDTVGTTSGGILLEVLIKDIRYKRCTVNGVEYGGLAATGFSLMETGPDTGRFEGVFKMPSKICNEDGTELISSAGGIIDLKYHDFRDSFGQPNIFTLSKDATSKTTKLLTTNTAPDSKTPAIPSWIKNNAKWWSSGVVSDKEFVDTIEFLAKEKIIVIKKSQTLEQSKSVPDWVKKSASWWADGLITDKEFAKGLEYLVNIGAIRI